MKKRNDEQKKKRNVVIFSLFIVFSMVISIFAIVLDNNSVDTLTYKGQKFVLTDSGYKTKLDNKFMDMYYYPSELERITMSPESIVKLRGSDVLVIIFDPNSTQEDLLYMDVMRYDMQQQIKTPTYFAISRPSDNYQLPVLTCANATLGMEVYIINSSSTTGFTSSEDGKCTIINAKLKELLAVKDRMVYTYYGVMNE